MPKRRDDYATGESKRWFKSSHSDQKETDAFASVSFCASVAVEPAASLIVPKQREGPRGNKYKTARWAVLSQFLRPKQGETEAKQCFARGSTRLGPSCVGNSRQVGATAVGSAGVMRAGVLADHVTAVPDVVADSEGGSFRLADE